MTKTTKEDKVTLCTGEDDGQVEVRDGSTRRLFGQQLIVICFLASLSGLFVCYSLSLLSILERYQLSQTAPEQLHLSLGANDNEYYVTWSTMEPARTQLVWCEQPCKRASTREGIMVEGIFDSAEIVGHKYHKYSYRAKMEPVTANKQYSYRVETTCNARTDDDDDFCKSESSNEYTFTARAFDEPNDTLKAIFYGDLGLKNAQSVPRLTKEIEQNHLIIHNGDFAYDLNTKHGRYGDEFMRLIEPIAARIPYQTSVGNHEIAANFSEYNHRFSMINRGTINHGSLNNFFYSFNAGPVHFVAFSTEFYYFLDSVGLASLVHQYNWLQEDLKFASSPTERAKRPWIVVFGHRPMYCSSRDHDDCSKDSNLLRRGLPFTGAYALEKLFYQFGVDVELYSHEHQYERFLPIYDGAVFNGTTTDEPYYNPRAPVHIISGSAGCQEKLDPFEGRPAIGSVKQISDYGYTRLVASKQSLQFEQISDDQNGTVVDKFVITKDQQNFPPTKLVS